MIKISNLFRKASHNSGVIFRSGLSLGFGFLLMLFVVGCGGGGGEATAMNKDQFLHRGNQICAEEQGKREQLFSEISSSKPSNQFTDADREKAMVEGNAFYEEATARLADLGPPKGDEKQVEAIVAAMEEAAERVKADPLSALTSNVPFSKANKLVLAYGLDRCDL